jgi:NAD(P)-dependent dehydrogenase (short-subunit alcohol dehydrogenase family)
MLSLAQELKGTGVTSNIISVKAIDVEHARENAPTKRNASWATPEEITAAMLYLCSEDAKLVNGAVIPIYGAA